MKKKETKIISFEPEEKKELESFCLAHDNVSASYVMRACTDAIIKAHSEPVYKSIISLIKKEQIKELKRGMIPTKKIL
jgi:hypothetical protein